MLRYSSPRFDAWRMRFDYGLRKTSGTRPFTLWTVTHPDHFVRIEVSARSAEEARRVAWQRWYRLPVRTDLAALMREAFGTDDTGVPAEKEPGPVSSGAKTNAP